MNKLFIAVFILFCNLACEEIPTNKPTSTQNKVNQNEIKFCDLIISPEKYKSQNIQTKAIVLGYHNFIFYSDQCLDQENITALEMSYESRHQLGTRLESSKITYKTNYLNNNLYAEIIVSGELKDNDEKEEKGLIHLKYKFFVSEIKDVNILLEEILPTEK